MRVFCLLTMLIKTKGCRLYFPLNDRPRSVMSRNELSYEIYKFYDFSLRPCKNYFFSCGFAKIAEFTILTILSIFSYRALRILQIFSPFVMLITTHQQSGADDFAKFSEIAEFINLTIFNYHSLPRSCDMNKSSSLIHEPKQARYT